jgi:hypothetical protein
MEKMTQLDAADILDRLTLDEVPEEYRDEVWTDGEEEWYVGEAGALSYSGKKITQEAFDRMVEESYLEEKHE